MDKRKEETSNYWKKKAGQDVNDLKPSTDEGGIARKNKSNEKISKMGIPICNSLPILEDDMIDDLKDIDKICKRAIASLLSIQLACDINEGYEYEKSKEIFSNLLKEFGVEDSLNSKEKKIFDGSYTKSDVLDVTWEYECYWSLLWALGLIDDEELNPNKICDCEKAVTLVSKSKDFNDFKSKCELRDSYEILDMLDLFYRYHWACVEKRINPNTNISDLNPEVVYERRRGLEWLFSEEEDWHEISLDT